MKSILVLAPHPEVAEILRGGLSADTWRILHRVSLEEAEPLLAHRLADVCVLDLDLNGVQSAWVIEKLRRQAPHLPLIVVAGTRLPEWEEDARLKGVLQVLSKPLRPRLFEAVLQQIMDAATFSAASAAPAAAVIPSTPPPVWQGTGSDTSRLFAVPPAGVTGLTAHPLKVMRDFSAILTHSLEAGALLRQFLLMIRELTGVNRAAIFLRPATPPFLGATESAESQALSAVCGIGFSAALLDVVKLSFQGGIGAQLHRSGRILRRSSPELTDPEARREFELLGAEVAVPILDREQLLGVALFDVRVTGEPLANSELELIFHLLEQVGLAVRNIRLHDQVTANHEMLAEVMSELNSACIVVSRDLVVLHANRTARKYYSPTGSRAGELAFSDLPPALGSKVFQVLKTGAGLAPFRFTPEDEPGAVYQVTISPIHRGGAATPTSVLLMVEDRTQAEQLRALEQKAEELKLLRTMAERLAAEIGNAIVPVHVHQQILPERGTDAEYRAKLAKDLADSANRINRLVAQMRYLGGGVGGAQESFPLGKLLDEAYQEARKQHPDRADKLVHPFAKRPVLVAGDRSALKHAFTEIFLNAFQSAPPAGEVEVRVEEAGDGAPDRVCLEVRDNGAGFSEEARQRAGTPFFTTRIPGVGLGLAVTRRILESHRGRLEIPQTGPAGVVRISLPVASANGG
jgi:signal transduction histidine kinase/CheY-like chemotaxis protein